MAVADTAGSLDSEMSGYRTHAHTDAHRHTHAHAHTTQRDMIAAASPICTDSMCMCLCVDPRSFVHLPFFVFSSAFVVHVHVCVQLVVVSPENIGILNPTQ